jgi:hypothetical protein
MDFKRMVAPLKEAKLTLPRENKDDFCHKVTVT